VAQAQGDVKGARVAFEESLSILRDLGDRSGRADAVAALGRVAQAQGDFALARGYLLESLELRRDLEQRFAIPQILEDLAGLAASQGRPLRALTLAEAAASVRERLGSPRTSGEQERIEVWHRASQLEAGEAPIAGRAMTLDEAIAYALGDDELTA
jgi:tetratricopeptide (TPR) repeat protein